MNIIPCLECGCLFTQNVGNQKRCSKKCVDLFSKKYNAEYRQLEYVKANNAIYEKSEKRKKYKHKYNHREDVKIKKKLYKQTHKHKQLYCLSREAKDRRNKKLRENRIPKIRNGFCIDCCCVIYNMKTARKRCDSCNKINTKKRKLEYDRSIEHKERRRIYERTDHRKEQARKYANKRRKTITYKLWYESYSKNKNVKLHTKIKRKEYLKSPKGIEVRRRYVQLRRARLKNATISKIDYNWINERDGFKCQICGKKIDMLLKHPHPMSISYDHIIPLNSNYKEHSNRNIQLAHLGCNSKKRDRWTMAQINLI